MKTGSLSNAGQRSAPWCTTYLLAVLGLACGVMLAGLSAWFLGSVAIAGLTTAALTFNFHIPGALVRLFAIGRTAARYGERTVGHNAALLDQCGRRSDLFEGLAGDAAIRAAGWQFGRPDRLADYIDDVEDLDYGRLRVDLPIFATGAGIACASVATVLIAPLALVGLLAITAVLALGTFLLDRRADGLWRSTAVSHREAAGSLGASLAATVALRAEDAFGPHITRAFDALDAASSQAVVLRRTQAQFDLLCALSGPFAAASVFGAAAIGGATGADLLPPAFLGFAWLALGEGVQGGSRIVLAAMRRRHALQRLSTVERFEDLSQDDQKPAELAGSLMIDSMPRYAPDGRVIGTPVALRLVAGRPTVLRGPSGCGKTSLLKQIGGWLGEDTFRSGQGVLPRAARQNLAFLCLHDAAVLADTVRANLFAVHGTDDEIWAALRAVELDKRFEACGLDGWIGQDTLSLGEAQRLNLARAWLSRKPLILLDEPTEHIDAGQAERILGRLLSRLSDRIVVLSSHRPIACPGAEAIQL